MRFQEIKEIIFFYYMFVRGIILSSMHFGNVLLDAFQNLIFAKLILTSYTGILFH